MFFLLMKKWLTWLGCVLFVFSTNGFASDTLTELERAAKAVSPADGIELLNKFDLKNSKLEAEQQAKVHFLYGQLYEKTRQLDQSIDSYDKGIELVRYLPITDVLIDSHLERSFAIYLQSNDPAAYCIDRKKALVYARQHHNSELLAKTLTQNAFCFIEPTSIPKGIALLDEAMAIVDKNNLNANRKALIYNATGSLYRKAGLHRRGYDSFEKAYQTWQSINDIEDMFNMQYNMLSEAISLGHWDKANQSVKAQFSLAGISTGDNDMLFFSHLNAGRVALRTYDYDKAVFHLEKAVSLNHTTQEKYFISSNYLYLGLAYMRSGEAEKAADMARIFKQDKSFAANQKAMLLQADAIIALDDHDPVSALNKLFQVIDIEREINQSVIDNEVIRSSLDHNSALAEFENELLGNRLAINELSLASVKDKERINELKLSLFFVVVTVLFCIVLLLLISRRTLKVRAQTDFLTGLANRGHTFKKGQKIIGKTIKKQQPASVIMFDIDNFKSINDRYGHHIGDLAIKAVSKRARRWLKKHDLVGRIGGEEFLIVLENTPQTEAYNIADRLRHSIEEQFFQFDDVTIEFTISLGVATLNEHTTTLLGLMKQADDALYRAKFSGKNKVYLAAECA